MGHTSEFSFGIYWWTLKNPKNQNFWKMKKIAGDIINLHMCTKNHNHMRYSSWQTKWDKFLVILGHFSPFNTPSSPPPQQPRPRKPKFWKIENSICGNVIILNLCNKKNTIKWCMLTQIWSATDIIFCHFRSFFALLLHYWPQKLKFGKNVKNSWTY